jgi:hypothetical protein
MTRQTQDFKDPQTRTARDRTDETADFRGVERAVLSGCTGTHIKPPPVCDGKHRRPANLYGSILPSLPVPVPPSQSSGQSLVAPPPAIHLWPPRPPHRLRRRAR